MTSGRMTLPRLRGLEEIKLRAVTLTQALASLQVPLLLVLTLLLLTLAYQFIQPQMVTVGPQDHRFIQSTNEREYIASLEREVRWTNTETYLDLPLVAARTPLVLSLTLINSYPDGLPPPAVDVVLDERWLADMYVPREPSGARYYHFLLPPQERASWAVPFTLYSTTITLDADPRPIGVMLAEAGLSTVGSRALLPPLWQVFAVLLIALASYLALRGLGAGRWLAWWLAMLGIAALAGGLMLRHLEIAPYTMRLAGLAGIAALYGLAVHLLTLTDRATTPRLTTSSSVLLMGLAFWLLPLYQLIMTVDGTPAVTPYPPTFWLGAITLVCCIGGVGMLFDMGRGDNWRRLLLAVLGVAAVVHLGIMIHFALGRSGPDFWILFRGARDWFRGGSMYDLVAVRENHFGHVFKVPPFYGMLFVPFAQQDGLMILLWHRLLNIALALGTAALLFRAYGVRLASAVGVGLLLLFNMRPLTDTIAFGQIDIMLLFLLVIAVIALQQGKQFWTGCAVALGTLFKLYPALLLVFFVVKRQWRALAGFGVALLVLNGLAIAVIGWQMHQVYLFEVVPRIGGGTSWVENQTLNGFLSRATGGIIDAAKFDHPLVSLATYGGFFLALGGAALLALRPAEPRSPQALLQFGLFPLLMVLMVPAAWMHYQTIVILPFFAVLLYSAANNDGLPRWRAALLGIAYALIAYGNQWSFFNGSITGALTFLGVSYKFYGLLLLLAVVVACLLDRSERGTSVLADIRAALAKLRQPGRWLRAD